MGSLEVDVAQRAHCTICDGTNAQIQSPPPLCICTSVAMKLFNQRTNDRIMATVLCVTALKAGIASAFLGDFIQHQLHLHNPALVQPHAEIQDLVACITSSVSHTAAVPCSPAKHDAAHSSSHDSHSAASNNRRRQFRVRMDLNEHQQDDRSTLTVDDMVIELRAQSSTPQHASHGSPSGMDENRLPWMPGAHGSIPQMSSGSMRCSITQPGKYVTLDGTQYVRPKQLLQTDAPSFRLAHEQDHHHHQQTYSSTTAHHHATSTPTITRPIQPQSLESPPSCSSWEICWIKDKPAGTLVCAIDIDRTHQRNSAVLHSGCIYMSFPIWSQQGLEHVGLPTKHQLYVRMEDCMQQYDDAMMQWERTSNPILKAMHWHHAEQAMFEYDHLDHRMWESIPETPDDMIELCTHDSAQYFLMKKGMIWSKDAQHYHHDKTGDLMLGWATLSGV